MSAESPVRVLCVHGSRDTATALSSVLRLNGVDARCASDGSEGLRIARRVRPDACVVDLRVPGLGGCELAHRLRSELGPNVLLVAVTGPAGVEDADRLDAAGFDWLFARPVDVAGLLDVLPPSGRSR